MKWEIFAGRKFTYRTALPLKQTRSRKQEIAKRKKKKEDTGMNQGEKGSVKNVAVLP
jgi:hypothetical protein